MGTDYTSKLNEKHAKIITDLQELQAVETYLFTKIQEAASSHQADGEQKKISSHILDSEILLSKTLNRSREEILVNLDKNINEKKTLGAREQIMINTI